MGRRFVEDEAGGMDGDGEWIVSGRMDKVFKDSADVDLSLRH